MKCLNPVNQFMRKKVSKHLNSYMMTTCPTHRSSSLYPRSKTFKSSTTTGHEREYETLGLILLFLGGWGGISYVSSSRNEGLMEHFLLEPEALGVQRLSTVNWKAVTCSSSANNLRQSEAESGWVAACSAHCATPRPSSSGSPALSFPVSWAGCDPQKHIQGSGEACWG